MIQTFLWSLGIGFFASIGLGPVTVLVIRMGIRSGWKPAFVGGFGSAVMDTLYGTMAFLGSGLLLTLILDYQDEIRIGMMVILLGVAWLVWRSKPMPVSEGEGKELHRTGIFFSTFSLALSNPLMVLIFLAVFASVSLTDALSLELWPFAACGLLIGTSTWWFVLIRLVCSFRTRLPGFLSSNLNRISAGVILGLGLYAGISGLLGLL